MLNILVVAWESVYTLQPPNIQTVRSRSVIHVNLHWWPKQGWQELLALFLSRQRNTNTRIFPYNHMSEFYWMKKLIYHKSFGQAECYAKLHPDKWNFMTEFFQAKKTMCHFSGQRIPYTRIFPDNSFIRWNEKANSRTLPDKGTYFITFLVNKTSINRYFQHTAIYAWSSQKLSM